MSVTPWVQRLIIANVLMFFLQATAPALTQQLVLVPALALQRPWTILTYMFLHGGFGHIFFNMLGLYFFGPRVEQRLGSERFIALYIVSGTVGALLSLVLGGGVQIVGASGALYGVLLAYARFWPRDQIYIWGIVPVEVRWLVLIYTAVSVMGWGSGIAHFAHLGGFVGAFFFLLYIEHRQGAKRFRKNATSAPPARDAMVGNWQKVNRDSVHAVNKEEVDRILDKISAQGLASLTPQERLFLSNFVPPDDRKPPVS
jgi:membrane associated rhomboid family serine protease